MSTQKRKRTDFTLEQKKDILDAAIKEPNQSELARMFTKMWGFEVKRTAVISILNSKILIEEALDSGIPLKRKKLMIGQHSGLDEAVLVWLKQAGSQNLPIGGTLLREKAVKLAELMHIENFKGSVGWLDKFRQRHGISLKTVQGEAEEADMSSLEEWQCRILRPLLEQFSPNDVFNLGETGLFWKLLPNKTMAFRGERCTSGEMSKERITLLVGANMSGSEKLPLLVIGKPSFFKNKEIPLKYRSNKRAWMTTNIFEETLKSWDRKLGETRRKVLLCLENCSSHPRNIELDNIRMVFFPPNTTAKSNPMDQGVIENVKRHYKKLLLRRRIAAIKRNTGFKLDPLNSLHLVRDAWDQVTDATVRNCFAKVKFVEEEAQRETEDAELVELWETLPSEERIHDGEEIKLSDFLEADDRVATDGILTLEEIAEDVLGTEDSEDDEEPILEERKNSSKVVMGQNLESTTSASDDSQSSGPNIDASQPEKAKRPKGPFLRFALANREKYQALHSKLVHHQLIRLMGKEWKNLSDDEKKPYNDQFHEELLEYKKLNPDRQYASREVAIVNDDNNLQEGKMRKHRLRPEPPKLLPFEPIETPRRKRRKHNDEGPQPETSNSFVMFDSDSYERYAEAWQHATQGNAFKTTAFMDIFRKSDAIARKAIVKEMAWGIFEHF